MITIRDVAREAGVSASTVSAVLGNRAGRLGIKAATCEKVVRAAAKLRYRRNDIAAQMKSGRRSSMLFLLSESVDNILFGGLAAACAEAENAGYFPKLLRVETENHEELRRRLELVLRQCPAAILCWGDRSGDETYLRRVTEECSIPFVHFDYVSRSSRAYVRTDDPSGIRSGVEHLHMLGHRRFAHITEIMKAQYAEVRLRDYREALAEFGLELPENRVLSLGLNAPESGVRTFLERMRGEGVTAITCGSDYFALQALTVLQRDGVRVPEEMSILGYGDLGFACNCYPRLSTIRQPQAELGVCAVRMACRMIRGEPVTEPVLLPSELVLRESAGPRTK